MRVLIFYLSSNLFSFPFLFPLGDSLNGILYQRAVHTKPKKLTTQQSNGSRPDGLLVCK